MANTSTTRKRVSPSTHKGSLACASCLYSCYFRKEVLLVLIGACVVLDGTAWAASSRQITLPINIVNGKPTISYSTQSGLQVKVDTTYVGKRGYRPVLVTFSSAKPLTADMQITVRFHAGLWRNTFRSITVEQDVEILKGSSGHSITLLVPQYVDWEGFSWEVWVDGKKDEQLTSPSNLVFNQSNSGNAQYAALIPYASTGNTRQAYSLQGMGNFVGPFQGLLQNNIDALSDSVSNLPEKWIGYSSIDMVIATPDELKHWNKNSPEQFSEMLRWVRAGGNLWVFDVGEEYEQLAQVETNVGINLKESTPEQRGWRSLPLGGASRQGADALVMLDGRKINDPKELLTESPEASSRDWFLTRAYGMGTITTFRKHCAELFPQEEMQSNQTMEAVEQSLLSERLNWRQRHGNDPGLENRGFNELLIPDVGAAPVFEFQLLLSLFVIGIGPLNYWLLKRRGQLPLILVTVPVAALATTVVLFAYGILSDGLGVRVRVRSVTLIDQAAGEAVCWARTSYYAGLAPAEGFTIPDDTAVYPIHPSRSSTEGIGRQFAQDQREVEWGSQQNLTRGWLASRTPTQYLSITSRASKKRLLFDPQKDRLSVTNELGVKIIWLIAQDHDGKFYLGDKVEADSSAELTESDLIPAMSQLRTMITDNVLELPAGFVVTQRQRLSRRNSQLPEFYSLSNNLMEAQINSLVSPLIDSWGNGTYIAVTAAGPELSLGIEDAIESDSFHIVRGSWTSE